MAAMKPVLAFALLASFIASFIFAIPMIAPFERGIAGGDEIYLGEIGPGQTIAISIDGRPTTGGIYNLGGTYETARASELPSGWSATESDWAGIPLQVKIKSDALASEGEYRIKMEVLDSQPEGLENITFYVKLNVTHEVLDVSLDSQVKRVLAGQPARFYITLDNKASTGDTFKVSSTNVPKWAFSKSVYVPAKSQKTIYYEVAGAEESTYSPLIEVVSTSSPLINRTLNTTVEIGPSVLADYKAANNGMLFFPAMNGLLYAFAGLISNLF